MKHNAQTLWTAISKDTKILTNARMPTASDASMDFLVSLKKNQSHKIVVSVNHNDLLDIKLIKLNKSACTFDVQACAWDVAIAELDQAIQNVYESGGKQNV